MSIFDVFNRSGGATGGQPQTTAGGQPINPNLPTNQPGQQGQQPNPNDPSLAGNNTVPGGGTPQSDGSTKGIPAVGEGDKSPLAGFKDLWLKSDTDRKPTSLAPNLTVDPQKLMDAAKGVDFTKAIPPEVIDKATKGDVAAFGQAINLAVQASFAQSAAATTKIVEAALTQQGERFQNDVMPEILRRHEINLGIKAENPLFENPAVKPMLAMVEQQLSIKYPTAAATEITAKAKEFMQGFASEIATSSGQQMTKIPEVKVGKSVGNDMDWSKFFEGT